MKLSELGTLANRKHSDLTLDISLNLADTNTTLNKHISNAQGKKWNDHSDNKNNPHETRADQIKSNELTVANGSDALIYEINKDTATINIKLISLLRF